MPKNSATAAARFKDILKVLRRYDLIKGLNPQKLRQILEDLGPTFIKLGQIMSMRPDMIPSEYCDELIRLRAEVKPMPYAEVLMVLEGEFGEAPEKHFSHIDETPYGAASIAQVHRARLKSGKDVVIKVQRPGIYEKMAMDIKLLRKASGIIRIIGHTGSVIDFNALIGEMWTVAQQEMDFLLEASHIREFAECNADIVYIAFPEVEAELTTHKVLVMEFIDGIQIDDAQALKENGYDAQEISEKLSANFVKQVVDDGFFHADPHPGNIRIWNGKIVWIDLGMVGRLSSRHRQLFKDAVVAAVENDVYTLKDTLLLLGHCRGEINHNRLYADVADMLSKYASMDLGSLDAGQFITELLRLAQTHGIMLPSGIAMLARGIMTIEGVLTKINPETNFLQVAGSHLSDSLFSKKNIERELRHAGRALYTFSKRAADIPGQMSDILKMASRGQAKLNLEFVGSEGHLSRLDHIVNRIIVCILNAAVVVGSSILCTTNMTPKFLGIPLLGVLGYGASFIMTVWLIYRILKNRSK
jgi:ubiquinone biosynthesis protein